MYILITLHRGRPCPISIFIILGFICILKYDCSGFFIIIIVRIYDSLLIFTEYNILDIC